MTMTKGLFNLCLLLCALTVCGIGNATEERDIGYDPQADPAQQLKQSVNLASAKDKLILLKVGGNWCSWCQLLHDYIAQTAPVNQAIEENFVVQQVYVGDENSNEAFLSQFPALDGYPHLYILNRHGELLWSQGTGALEQGHGYNTELFVQFLGYWAEVRRGERPPPEL